MAVFEQTLMRHFVPTLGADVGLYTQSPDLTLADAMLPFLIDQACLAETLAHLLSARATPEHW